MDAELLTDLRAVLKRIRADQHENRLYRTVAQQVPRAKASLALDFLIAQLEVEDAERAMRAATGDERLRLALGRLTIALKAREYAERNLESIARAVLRVTEAAEIDGRVISRGVVPAAEDVEGETVPAAVAPRMVALSNGDRS